MNLVTFLKAVLPKIDVEEALYLVFLSGYYNSIMGTDNFISCLHKVVF